MPLLFVLGLTMQTITLYHNPKCSKSRETLAILQENGVNVQIVEYLQGSLTAAEIKRLIDESGVSLKDAIRSDVAEYQHYIADKHLSEAEIFALIAQHPMLLNRPFASGEKGVKFCRPPELVKELL